MKHRMKTRNLKRRKVRFTDTRVRRYTNKSRRKKQRKHRTMRIKGG